MKYADIIVDISLEALDRVFQYIVPETLTSDIQVGQSGDGSLWKGKSGDQGLCYRLF